MQKGEIMNGYAIVIIGGGSTWTPGILKSLAMHCSDFPLRKIALYDTDEKRLAAIGEFGKILFREEAPQVEFLYTTDKKTAYTGADFAFCQIRTGGYPMREQDEKIPLNFDVIGQETCGPGGFAYGMRSIKDMIELVQDVRSYSDAWILNYTNPAAIIAPALAKALPDEKKVLNICDQPINLLRSYGRLINYDYKKFTPRYFGLNHFGWFTHIFDEHGNDLAPKIKAAILSEGFKPVDAEQRDTSWLDTYAIVKDMLEDFPEYLPNTYLQYYLYPEYKASKMSRTVTRATEVINGREKSVFDECRRVIQRGSARNANIVHNDAHGDMIVEIALSMAHNRMDTYVVIVPNNGIIENVPKDAMVEVAASLGVNGPSPYAVGVIGSFYKGLLENQHAFESLTVQAFFEQSYSKALAALTLNRTVVDAKKARKILDALIEANKGYWPELK